jgi:hypothetical protein
MRIPTKDKLYRNWMTDLTATCRVTAGQRASEARELRAWRMFGSDDEEPAIYNFLGTHIDRLASSLFSPAELRFYLEYESRHSKADLQKAGIAARVVTREFERRDVDMSFAFAVEEALAHGACFPKVSWGYGGTVCRLVMPWQFGVYNEAENDLGMQEAVCETYYITAESLWRRISHLPNADAIYKRAMTHVSKENVAEDDLPTFVRATLSGTAPGIQTDQPYTSQPGGMVQGASPATLHVPQIRIPMLKAHELYVVNDETQDYTTIQFVEPDIILTRPDKPRNLFVPGCLPYGMVQPNRQQGYFWGTSELGPLLKLQYLVGERLSDIRRIMSLQYDRLLAFTGFSGMNDELYDQFRNAGWIANENPSAKVEDLTPKLPENAFQEVQSLIKYMEQTSGFSNILSGEGEPGVRAGNHAQTLLRTASPRLRDRALVVERQCADLGDKVFQMLAAKRARAYWLDPEDNGASDFLLEHIVDKDYRLTVDSHSSSPIYQQDHAQLAAFLLKAGVIDGESTLEMLPVPMRDTLIERYLDAQKKKAEFAQQHPEIVAQQATKRPARR